MILSHLPKSGRSGLFLVLSGLTSLNSYGATVQPAISLDPPEPGVVASQIAGVRPVPVLAERENFRQMGSARAGEASEAQKLTLRFAATTKLTGIASTPDFKVEQGSSCVEGNVYSAKTTCTLLVRFAPKGPGRRLGKLTISNSASVTPMYVGLGGNGYAPSISFTPALITTLPGTFVNNAGLLKSAQNLAVDGGDSLYIADTGNNLIRYIDSSGVVRTISSGSLSAPLGVAVDSFGDVYFSEPAARLMYEIFNYGSQLQISGTGTDSCTVAAPCKMPNELLYAPGQMSMDANNQLFFAEQSLGAAIATVLPYSPSFARLYDPFTYQEAAPDAFAVDAYDNLYSFWNTTGVCAITSQYFSDASITHGVYKKVAGGRACGFSGDGGQARNAEIGTTLGQINFDIAGNLYFTDTNNNRVRRIDASTGIVNTIAGQGVAGYAGDNGPSTSALVTAPTGVAVDSSGIVYIISRAAATGTAQVVRKVGPNGALGFPPQLRGTTSATRFSTIANTGNSALTFTRVLFTGTNPGDFVVDPATTSCNFAAGNSLAAGHSCQVGIYFKPTAAGTRTANLTFLDNTATNFNTIRFSAQGSLPAPVLKITAPAAGATVASGTTVKFSVSVTTTSGAAPTGKVQFSVDGGAFGAAVTVASGGASVNLTGLTVKTHTISAAYSGDANYAAATVSETLIVH